LLFKAKITDKAMAQEVANGYWKAVSVRVKRDLEIQEGKLSCLNLRYIDLTLTKTPACKVCQVTSVSVDKLHLYKEKQSLLENSDTIMSDDDKSEELAKWSTAYKNSLPDSAFIIIEPEYKSGECKNKNARHLPYKDANGKVDMIHLRKAVQLAPKVKAVCGGSTAVLRPKAIAAARRVAKGHGIKVKETSKLTDEKDNVLNKILGILGETGSDTEKMQKVKDVAVVAKLQSMDTSQLISHFSEEVTALRKEVAELKSTKPEVEDPKTKTPCEKEKKGEETMTEDPKPKDDDPKKIEEPKKDEDPKKEDEKETKKEDKPEDIKEDKDKKPEEPPEPPKKEEVKEEEKKEEDKKEKIPTIEEIIKAKEKSPDELADLAVKLFFEHTKRQSSE